MLKQSFKDQIEFDIHLTEQKIRMEKGYLTRTERDQLKKMLEKNYKPVIIKEEIPNPNIKSIVTDINLLRKPCLLVEKGEDVKQIIIELKETLNKFSSKALGLSANQIGYNKSVCYIRVPYFDQKNKKTEIKELILINPKIIEKDKPIKVQNESCLSFPGISVTTKRYVYCTVYYLDENFKEHTALMQDLESLVILHEYDHTIGKTIFDNRYKDINRRTK
jgi:peptide deformylase